MGSGVGYKCRTRVVNIRMECRDIRISRNKLWVILSHKSAALDTDRFPYGLPLCNIGAPNFRDFPHLLVGLDAQGILAVLYSLIGAIFKGMVG